MTDAENIVAWIDNNKRLHARHRALRANAPNEQILADNAVILARSGAYFARWAGDVAAPYSAWAILHAAILLLEPMEN